MPATTAPDNFIRSINNGTFIFSVFGETRWTTRRQHLDLVELLTSITVFNLLSLWNENILGRRFGPIHSITPIHVSVPTGQRSASVLATLPPLLGRIFTSSQVETSPWLRGDSVRELQNAGKVNLDVPSDVCLQILTNGSSTSLRGLWLHPCGPTVFSSQLTLHRATRPVQESILYWCLLFGPWFSGPAKDFHHCYLPVDGFMNLKPSSDRKNPKQVCSFSFENVSLCPPVGPLLKPSHSLWCFSSSSSSSSAWCSTAGETLWGERDLTGKRDWLAHPTFT